MAIGLVFIPIEGHIFCVFVTFFTFAVIVAVRYHQLLPSSLIPFHGRRGAFLSATSELILSVKGAFVVEKNFISFISAVCGICGLWEMRCAGVAVCGRCSVGVAVCGSCGV